MIRSVSTLFVSSLVCLLSVPVKSLKCQILIFKCCHISILFLNRYGTSCYYQFNWNDTRSYDIQGDWFFLPSFTHYDRARKQKRKRYLFSSLPNLFNLYLSFLDVNVEVQYSRKGKGIPQFASLYSSNHQILLAVKVMAELTRTLRTNSFIIDYHHSEKNLLRCFCFDRFWIVYFFCLPFLFVLVDDGQYRLV